MKGAGMDGTAIVVIAYNRVKPLKRLIDSLLMADYPAGKDIPLIISIDKSDNREIIKVAEEFEWKYGKKRIATHEEQLGLKKHVLECGDYSREYGSVILLEDDLFVMRDFYNFALSALDHTKDDEKTGGVSLYSHRLNVHAREDFSAIDDGFDNYYMQFASSWGQAYTKAQWQGFRDWLENKESLPGDGIPENVRSWSESSWLKFNIAYLIEKNMYFLYPRSSMTTNFMSKGEHSSSENFDLQVPLGIFSGKQYRFSKTNDSGSKYDAFFENTALRELISERLSLPRKELVIDLYGCRGVIEGKRYLLSSEALPFRILKSYGRSLRPVDANIIYDIEGESLFLYDTKETAKAPKLDKAERCLYNYRALSMKKMLEIIKYRVKNR
ncbi:MAG: glycosyltransferase [Lachnospiraceae bacterium]|nr:glycosyltransferase [Lachnospiraceae bacterium]